MTSTPSPAAAVLVFMGRFVSTSRTSATPNRVRMEGPALTALERIDAPARWDTMDRTARYTVCWCVFHSKDRVLVAIQCEVSFHLMLRKNLMNRYLFLNTYEQLFLNLKCFSLQTCAEQMLESQFGEMHIRRNDKVCWTGSNFLSYCII